MPASSWARSSAYIRDRPSEAASSPAACGARSRPRRCRRPARSRRGAAAASVASPNSSTMTSKVQSSPRWLQNTPSMSKGVASNRSATPSTSAGATNRNTARGSTKRRISQGQAMRSTFGRARVTQTVRPCAIERAAFWRSGPAAGRPCFQPRSRLPARRPGTPACRSHAATPSLSFAPFWQIDDGGAPGEFARPVRRHRRADGASRREPGADRR